MKASRLKDQRFVVLELIKGPLATLLILWVFLGWLLPRIWIELERLWWRFSLGASPAADEVIVYALKEFRLLISEQEQQETGEGRTRPVAVLLAIAKRLHELSKPKGVSYELRRLKDEKERWMLRDAIKNLNEGWPNMPRSVLEDYMKLIKKSSSRNMDDRESLSRRSIIANVELFLGRFKTAHQHGSSNWTWASANGGRDGKATLEGELMIWMSSYAYFNSTTFLGQFKTAMDRMTDHWQKHYVTPHDKKDLVRALSTAIMVNPIISIPRHIILAAALYGSYDEDSRIYLDDPKYWPKNTLPQNWHTYRDQKELKWVESWYEEAKEMCRNYGLSIDFRQSLDFTHAYVGFYYTLLYAKYAQEKQSELATEAKKKAEGAFEAINQRSIVSRYVKAGFLGIYSLVTNEAPPGEALKHFQEAASYSQISIARYLDCLFLCCAAVAAQRDSAAQRPRYRKPEVDYYLKTAEEAAMDSGSLEFYSDLYEEADRKIRKKDVSEERKIDPAANRLSTLLWQGPDCNPQGSEHNKEDKHEHAILNLTDAWSNMAHEVAKPYMNVLKSFRGTDDFLNLWGQSTLANMEFLSGELKDAQDKAKKNVKKADRLKAEATRQKAEADEKRALGLKYIASHVYFGSTLLLGECERAMDLMADYWREYSDPIEEPYNKRIERRKEQIYKELKETNKEGARRELIKEIRKAIEEISNERTKKIKDIKLKPNISHSLVSIPRLMILAAAFNGSPKFDKKYWPCVADFTVSGSDKKRRELEWVRRWYETAKASLDNQEEAGKNDTPLLDFSHAYAGFYYTLLFASQAPESGQAKEAKKEAERAFNVTQGESITSLYVQSGFYGIHRLVIEKDPREALEWFQKAANYSAISPAKFLDCLFLCCAAVAAQRDARKRYREPEVKNYLDQARKVAEKAGSSFYFDLYNAAYAEVCKKRGATAQAKRYEARITHMAGDRMLNIFDYKG